MHCRGQSRSNYFFAFCTDQNKKILAHNLYSSRTVFEMWAISALVLCSVAVDITTARRVDHIVRKILRLSFVCCHTFMSLHAVLRILDTGSTSPSRHVAQVYVMLENHAFDNMVGWLPGLSNPLTSSDCNSYAGVSACASRRGAYVDPDPDHSVQGTALEIFGTKTPPNEHDPASVTMSGFVQSYADTDGGNATFGAKIMVCACYCLSLLV